MEEEENNGPTPDEEVAAINESAEASQDLTDRRFTLRPRKRKAEAKEENENPAKKRNPCKSDTLETIFEEPIVKKNGAMLFISASKCRRYITFKDYVTKKKLKVRKAKAAKIKSRIKHNKDKRPEVSLQEVQSKLWNLEV